jgi:hypothetical protein
MTIPKGFFANVFESFQKCLHFVQVLQDNRPNIHKTSVVLETTNK